MNIAGETIELGQTRDLKIRFSESYLGTAISIPVRVIRAKEEGPILYITGSIHGDEIIGVGIIRGLLFDNPPNITRGTLVCIPVVNPYGLEHHSRYLPDRRDLNRSFPGSPTGSLSSRLAHSIWEQVVSKCDYGIDFHTAAVRRTNYPNIRADMRKRGVSKLAKSFGCELVVDSKSPEGSLRQIADATGIPTITVEAGEVWKMEPGVVEVGIRGCFNVLRWLGMVSGKPEPPLFQVTLKKSTWVRAERGGFLGFHVKPGDLVTEGQHLATNYSIFGAERNLLTSPVNGIVLGMTTMPAAKPGEPVFHIAHLTPKQMSDIGKKIDRSDNEELFVRLQDDLATNFNVEEVDP